MEENLNAILADPVLSAQIEYIIIDDGWQNGYGDWEVSSKFHGSLAGIVEKIRHAGFKPGIWVAPFMADDYNKTVLRTPEMLARNAQDKYDFGPGGNGGFGVIDPTQPDAEKKIRKVFESLRAIGFEYFKVDFVKFLMQAAKFYSADRRIDMVTHGMEIIRQSIGPDAILTGCGMPVYGGYGIVDAMRVSADMSTFWSSVLSSARDLTVTGFFNRRAWINDPDFLLVRSPLATDEKRYNPFFLPKDYEAFVSRSGETIRDLNETLVWCTMVILSGGCVILSDNVAKLNALGKELAGKVLTNTCAENAVPLDLFESGLPAKWFRGGKAPLFAFFNWEDEPVEMTHHVGVESAQELWSGEKLQLDNGFFREVLPPRSVRVLLI